MLWKPFYEILNYRCILECLPRVLNSGNASESDINAWIKRAAVRFMCGTLGSGLRDRGEDSAF